MPVTADAGTPRRRLVAAGGLVACLALCSCAGGPVTERATSNGRVYEEADGSLPGADPSTTTTAVPGPAFAGSLAEAAAASAAQGTVRVSTEVSLDGEVVSELTVERGDGGTARLTSGRGDAVTFEAMLVDSTTYVRADELSTGHAWVAVPFAETYDVVGVDPAAILAGDPIGDFAAIAAAPGRVEVAEEEVLGGERTAWYRLTTSVAGLVDEFVAFGVIPPGSDGPPVSLANRSTLELGAHGDGLLHTLRFDVDVAMDGTRRELRLVQTFDDYGVRPSIVAPDPASTTTLDEATEWVPEQEPLRS